MSTLQIIKLVTLVMYFFVNTNLLMAQEQKYNVQIQDDIEFTCFTEWIIVDTFNNGKPFRPMNDNLKSAIISFSNKMNTLKYVTTNYTSYVDYESFFNLKYDNYGLESGTLGMTFTTTNNNGKMVLFDIFNNGNILVWMDNKVHQKYICPSLKLNVKKVK